MTKGKREKQRLERSLKKDPQLCGWQGICLPNHYCLVIEHLPTHELHASIRFSVAQFWKCLKILLILILQTTELTQETKGCDLLNEVHSTAKRRNRARYKRCVYFGCLQHSFVQFAELNLMKLNNYKKQSKMISEIGLTSNKSGYFFSKKVNRYDSNVTRGLRLLDDR